MIIHFFAKFNLTEKERLFMVIFQLDVVHNWLNKLAQKSMDEKSSPFVIHKPQNGSGGINP
jgi:hypothetical protein